MNRTPYEASSDRNLDRDMNRIAAFDRPLRHSFGGCEKKQVEKPKIMSPGNPNLHFPKMNLDYLSNINFNPLKMDDQVVAVSGGNHLIVHHLQSKVDLTPFLNNEVFSFDYAFDENANNGMVYQFTAQPLVKTIFDQGFATYFAYEQTGSGKMHSMGGTFAGKTQDCSKGIYALTASDVFKLLNKECRKHNLQVYCSFFEIYSSKVFDLLGNEAMLRVLEDGKKEVQVLGLQEVAVSKEEDMFDVIKKGTVLRRAGTTSLNANSSRSHAIF